MAAEAAGTSSPGMARPALVSSTQRRMSPGGPWRGWGGRLLDDPDGRPYLRLSAGESPLLLEGKGVAVVIPVFEGNSCVVGLQWGDEGKGKIVDFLGEQADVVVRYCGGANAGHTVRIGSEKYATHLLPVGVFRP